MKYIDNVQFEKEYIYTYLNEYGYECYPFNIIYKLEIESIDFFDITILYGNNGSGKSTLLNVIAEKLNCSRKTDLYKHILHTYKVIDGVHVPYKFKPMDDINEYLDVNMVLDDYGRRPIERPAIIKYISSEDVFSEIDNTIKHNRRSSEEILNAIEDKHEIIRKAKDDNFKYRCMADYERMKQVNEVYANSDYKYALKHTTKRAYKINSNGETALMYFDNIFENDGIYLLDEPENCLSPVFQLKLMEIIEYVTKYCGCQFIIATHSPLILSLKSAKIYNLDKSPVEVNKWNELENVKLYYEFFKSREKEFD